HELHEAAAERRARLRGVVDDRARARLARDVDAGRRGSVRGARVPGAEGMSLVNVERDGAIAIVLLNRPQQLNALSSELMGELAEALQELDADEAIHCIVLGGGERAFAAGADVGELAAGTPISLYQGRRLDRWDAIR